MVELSVTSTSIIEPISIDEVKAFMGFPQTDTSQDAIIKSMITLAREWLEAKTALSLISKSYKARFSKSDADADGFYELPVSPVTGTPVVNINGISTTYISKGLNVIYLQPAAVYYTSSGSEPYYLEVTFTAGATNETANMIICAIVADLFNNRSSDMTISMGRLSYNIIRMIQSISMNVSL